MLKIFFGQTSAPTGSNLSGISFGASTCVANLTGRGALSARQAAGSVAYGNIKGRAPLSGVAAAKPVGYGNISKRVRINGVTYGNALTYAQISRRIRLFGVTYGQSAGVCTPQTAGSAPINGRGFGGSLAYGFLWDKNHVREILIFDSLIVGVDDDSLIEGVSLKSEIDNVAMDSLLEGVEESSKIQMTATLVSTI